MIATVSLTENSGGVSAPVPTAQPATQAVVTSSKKRVLLVDDEDCLTTLFSMALERTGRFQVRVENQGSHAVAAALEFQPDLIFLDHHMPDREGVQIAAELQAESTLRSVPLVFLTGSLSREEAERQNTLGGFETMTKPVDRFDFVNRALELCGASPVKG